ncbi:MAG: response regulator [Caulobacteraceae bacterium]
MCHVLIIEDEALIAMHIEDMLADLGATSFAFAETEAEALREARLRKPALITSDVRLRHGTGPRAVEVILRELGPLPVIFITATPEDCTQCEPPARVLAKPLNEASIGVAFRELAPVYVAPR